MKEMNTGASEKSYPIRKQTFHRRMGGTTYEVHVCFKEQAELMEDKVLRMIRNDTNTAEKCIAQSAAGEQALIFREIPENVGEAQENHFQNEPVCDMMTMPQMSRSA